MKIEHIEIREMDQVTLQFKAVLLGINPPIWRQILVPSTYTFWDLHVALQDSMGWLDYHLHQFSVEADDATVKIGIPDDEFIDDDEYIEASWEIGITRYFSRPGDKSLYEYDFGDGWEHEIVLERISLRHEPLIHPLSLGGERSCPPEDCHGPIGYAQLLEILEDPTHEEFQEMNDWLKGHAKNYYPFKSEEFDAQSIRFRDSKKQLDELFTSGD